MVSLYAVLNLYTNRTLPYIRLSWLHLLLIFRLFNSITMTCAADGWGQMQTHICALDHLRLPWHDNFSRQCVWVIQCNIFEYIAGERKRSFVRILPCLWRVFFASVEMPSTSIACLGLGRLTCIFDFVAINAVLLCSRVQHLHQRICGN